MPGRGQSIRRFRFTRALTAAVIALVLAVFPLTAAAQDLFQVYREAQSYDAVYAAARHSVEAGRERRPQGLALLLPTLNLSSQATRTRNEVDSRDPLILPSFTRYPESAGYTLTFTQPLFRYQNWIQYEQSGHQVRQAEADLRPGLPGPDRARGAGLLRRAGGAGHADAGARAARGDLRAARAGEAQLRGRHRDHHRHARGAGALRPERRQRDRGAERPREQAARAAARSPAGRPASSSRCATTSGSRRPTRTTCRPGWSSPRSRATRCRSPRRRPKSRRSKRSATPRRTCRRSTSSPATARPAQNATTESSAGRDTTQTVIGLQLAMPLFQGGALTSRDRESAALAKKAQGRPGERAPQRRALRAPELPRGEQRHRPGRRRWSRR